MADNDQNQYRTKAFIEVLAKHSVLARGGGPISINTLVGLETKLGLIVRRMKRDDSRIWTDEHLEKIKTYWLEEIDAPPKNKSA